MTIFYISAINKTSPCAKVNGIMKAISPMKKAKTCSYFDGKITDGKATLRVFGFDAGVRCKLVELEKNNEPVQLTNCKIQKSRQVLVPKNCDLLKCKYCRRVLMSLCQNAKFSRLRFAVYM